MDDACGCVQVAPNFKLEDEVYLFGYPVEENNVKHEVNLYGAKGKIVKSTQTILYYDMETGAGQSGGPILVENEGNWKVVGIHTVSDPSGIYINRNVADTLNSWIRLEESTLAVEEGSTIHRYPDKVFGDKAPKL
jgi:V8-like Glu-specific endopeptidase